MYNVHTGPATISRAKLIRKLSAVTRPLHTLATVNSVALCGALHLGDL